ncbi:hypothetical protein BDY19DRAFT_581359 [Irpex rosettiformis]|uniref:Uncharacterized protein n=1 Tax=Irpex rosettiformis TaxID=378272 RepID=A0ACB8UD06_9APHY|nr:hypothetical protein BDY19DRAFT_581359 [Irpex rosettiformis]
MCNDTHEPTDFSKAQIHRHGGVDSNLRPDILEIIEAKIDELSSDLRELSLSIHENPELGFEERHAHDILTGYIEKHGFDVTRHYKLETAWRATYTHGTGGLTLGINSEMDALPNIGHACGHNLIAVSGIAMACSVKAVMEKYDVSGTIILLGTPAEEAGGGKALLLEKGAYEGIDVCVMTHPVSGPPSSAILISSLARSSLDVTYNGKPAHAGNAPWEGKNALDAAVLAYTNVSLLRQQLKPDHRVHGIIKGDNWVVNVIPDNAKMEWLIRAPTAAEVESATERIRNCLEAAAIATGCRATFTVPDPAYKELRNNEPLAKAFDDVYSNQYKFGPTMWIPTPSGASTDFGNVSFEIPSVHPMFAIPTDPGQTNHTAGFTRASSTSEAHTLALNTCKALACVGMRVLMDEGFYREVRKSFEKDVELRKGRGRSGRA